MVGCLLFSYRLHLFLYNSILYPTHRLKQYSEVVIGLGFRAFLPFISSVPFRDRD